MLDCQSLIDELLQETDPARQTALVKANIPLLDLGCLENVLKVMTIQALETGDEQKLNHIDRLVSVLELELTNLPLKAMLVWIKSLIAYGNDDLDKTIELTTLAYNVFKDAEMHYYTVRLGANLINYYVKDKKNYKKADEFAEIINNYCVKHSISVLDFGVYHNWAVAKFYQNDIEQAYTLFEAQKSGLSKFSQFQKAVFYADAGPVYLQKGNIREAEQMLFASYEILKNNVYKGIVAYRLGQLYLQSGHLEKALNYAQFSIEVDSLRTSYQEDYAWSVVLYAQILLSLGQHHVALHHLEQVRSILESTESPLGFLHYQTLLAQAYAKESRFFDAQKELEHCLKILDSKSYWAVEINLSLAKTKMAQSFFNDAIKSEALHLLEEIYEQVKNTRPIKTLEVSLLFAQAFLNKDLATAEYWVNQIKQEMLALFPEFKTQYLFLKGQIEFAKQNWLAAQNYYKETLDIFANQLNQINLDIVQSGLAEQKSQLFTALLETCLKLSDWEAFWQYSEQFHAFRLAQTLTVDANLFTLPRKTQDLVMALKGQRFQLCSKLYMFDFMNVAYGGKTDDEDTIPPNYRLNPIHYTISPAEEAEFRQKINDIDQQLQELLTPLSRDNQTVIALDDVKQKLDSQTIIVLYTCVGKQYVVLCLSQEGIQWQGVLPQSVAEIRGDVVTFCQLGIQLLRDEFELDGVASVQNNFEARLASDQALLTDLYQALWQPLAEVVAPYTNVVVVADEELHQLPFQALYSGRDYLIDRHIISYAPSATVYFLGQERAQVVPLASNPPAVLLAYPGYNVPLEFVQQEVEEIQKFYPRSTLLVNQEATYSALKQSASSAQIIHLATHGHMNSQNPFVAHMELAPEKDENPISKSRMNLYDIAQLNLQQTKLVCLSACDTGQGVNKGVDVIGLQWAFLTAGACAVIASPLPTLDYASYQLMVYFHQQYHTTQQPSSALRQAQLWARQQGEAVSPEQDETFRRFWAHPYFWASYAVYGFA